ncbi:MAG: CPBP family intramembrane metalloprotease [Prevotella sp.]|nr:CPBP family intramembrane metalloprotease [Prevotella sp.]
MKQRFSLLTAIAYVVVFLGIQGFSSAMVMLVVALTKGRITENMSAQQTILTMILFSVLTVAVFVWARWFRPSASYLRSRPWTVLTWSVIAALGAIVPSMFCQEWLPEWPEWIQKIVDETEQQFTELMSTRGGYFVVALLAPVVEEIVFRGAVLRTLLSWQPRRRWLMIGLSALLFAAAHLNPAQMPHAFVIGLLLGWMYSRTDSIVPGIAYHWANNTAAYLLFVFYPDPSLELRDLFGGQVGRELLAVGFSLCILLPALFQLNQTMKKASSRT